MSAIALRLLNIQRPLVCTTASPISTIGLLLSTNSHKNPARKQDIDSTGRVIPNGECVREAIECFLGDFSSHGEASLATRLSRRPEKSAMKMATAPGCCGNIIATL